MDWQQLVVYLIGIAAVVYLVRRALRKEGACGGCSTGCATSKTRTTEPPPPTLIQIEPRPRRPE